MKILSLPGTDLRVSSLCLGTADMGTRIRRETAFRMLDTFVERGGNFLDTAKIYADWLPVERSLSEKLLAAWVSNRGLQGKVVIATKGAHFDLDRPSVSRVRPEAIAADIRASREHLQVAQIDLYYLHRDDPDFPVGELVSAMDEQVKAGTIRHWAVSNWRAERIRAAREYARLHHLADMVANQPLWNLAAIEPNALSDPTLVVMDDAMKAEHRQSGMAVIPYSAQANGYFNKLAEGRRAELNSLHRKMYENPENERRFERLQVIMEKRGLTVTQVVLGYLRAHPFPVIPIVGCQSMEQLADSLLADEVALSAAERDFLEEG